jgi:16S rRNA G966 N2-methylase RsmD
MTTLVELYAGTAALSLHLFGLRPPVSRIGSKQGYAAAIAQELELHRPMPDVQCGTHGAIDRVLLVDTDQWVCATLLALCTGNGPAIAEMLRAHRATKAAWADAKRAMCAPPEYVDEDETAAHWLYVTAAARGGVGGFKGGHIRRPSVKGWIPSLPSLCARLQAFDKPLPVEVRCCRAQDVAPFGDSVVYLDPPYAGRTGYPRGEVVDGSALALQGWYERGATIALSSPHAIAIAPTDQFTLPNALGRRRVELTHRRKGQTRRSLTRSSEEWLHIFRR